MTRLVAARNECAEGEHSKFQRPFLQTVMSVGPISNRAATLRKMSIQNASARDLEIAISIRIGCPPGSRWRRGQL